MKKLLMIVAIFALVGAACNQTNQPSPTPTPSPSPAPAPTPTPPTTQVYSNASYSFEFTYPVYAKFVGTSYANLADKIVQVQIGKDHYPNTNFSDAAISVSAASATSLANCLAKAVVPENSDGFKTKVQNNGTDFYMTKSSGAGAGNLYESTVYRTRRSDGTCIEVNLTIHTSNIANFPTGTVTEVNKSDVTAKLNDIFSSFKFVQ